MKNRIIKILAVFGILLMVFCTAAGSANKEAAITAAAPSGTSTSGASIKLVAPAHSQLTAHTKETARPNWLPGAFSTGTSAVPSASVVKQSMTAASQAYGFSKALKGLYPPAKYSYSEEEKAYVARVVYAEARGEIFSGKVAVAAVVLKRFESGRFGKTVKRVVFARNQFAVSKKYSAECMAAVEVAIDQSETYPEDMYYFRVSKSKNWRNFDYYTRIGNHSFYCA